MNNTTVVRIKRQGGVVVQDCDIYIGRQCYMGGWTLPKSKWYNPYSVKQYGKDAIPLYEQHIRSSNLMNDLGELLGMRLGCWCKPAACHGDILIKLLREKYPQL